jgi:hypothetical protein
MPNWCYNYAEIKCPSKEVYFDLFHSILEKRWFKTFAPLGLPGGLDNESGWDFKTACGIWKTKWDADEVDIFEQDDNEFIIKMNFDTAWTPPTGVYKIMSQKFGIETTSYYYEPGCCFFGRYIISGDEEIDESFSYPSDKDELMKLRKTIDNDFDEFMTCEWEQLEEDWEEECEEEEECQEDN